MTEAWLALGGNLGDVRLTFERAIDHLCTGGDVRLLARSSDYATPPWGVTDQPRFVNAVIAAETNLAAPELLARAHAAERTFGRERQSEIRNGPRTLDIDLLDYGGQTIRQTGLTLPHPRLHERAFVLVPLLEIRPDARIGDVDLARALNKLDASGIERLPRLSER